MNPGIQRNECHHNPNETFYENGEIYFKDLAIGLIFLCQVIAGVLGNLFLLYHHVFLLYKGNKIRFTDVILKHFFIANLCVLFAKGIPYTTVAFGMKELFREFVCKILFYVEKVGRTVSIGTICILSVVQNIMISPTNSCWKDVKVKVLKYTGLSIHLCWIVNMLFNLIVPLYTWYLSTKHDSEYSVKKINAVYCCLVDYGVVAMDVIYIALVVVPEVCFSVLIVWASGCMVFTLYRHKQRVQHIHNSNDPLRCPETRATKSILVLVSTFVSFYTLSTFFHTSMAILPKKHSWLMNTSYVISMCFPTISPFLIISQDSSILSHCSACIRNRKLL